MGTWIEISATLIPLLIGFGMLKKGQADQEKRDKEVRNEITLMRAELQPVLTAVAVQNERYTGIKKDMERQGTENQLAHDEMKGDIRRHERQIQGLEKWKAATTGEVG